MVAAEGSLVTCVCLCGTWSYGGAGTWFRVYTASVLILILDPYRYPCRGPSSVEGAERAGGGRAIRAVAARLPLLTTRAEDPTLGLCLGPYGGPRGGGLFLMSEVPL